MVKIDRGAPRQAGSLDRQDIRKKRRPAPTYFPTNELTQSIKNTSDPAAEPRQTRAKLNLNSTDEIQQKRDTSNRLPSSS